MSQTPARSVVEAGCDWITVSACDDARRDALSRLAFDLQQGEAARGYESRYWGMSGYQGRMSGGCQWGERADGVLVRLTGPLAYMFWRQAYDLSDNVSRFDVQLTVRTGEDTSRVIARHYREARRHVTRAKAKHDVSLFRSVKSSSTLYLGRRSSDRYGRAYCKDVESGLAHYSGCVRYELECKNDLARKVASTLQQTTPLFTPRGAKSRRPARVHRPGTEGYAAAAGVQTFFQNRGLSLGTSYNALQLQLPRHKPDSLRKLAWLTEQIGPAVAQLLADGYEQEVINALGLAHLAHSSRHKAPIGAKFTKATGYVM